MNALRTTFLVAAAIALSACAANDNAGTATQPTDNGAGKVVDDPNKNKAPDLLDIGAQCKGDGECKSGRCENTLCAAGKLKLDEVCKGDGECASGICFSEKCAAACDKNADCASGKACLTDNGARLFCAAPTFHEELGVSCAAHGKCPAGLVCSHPAEAAEAICTATCKTDLDCPTNLACVDTGTSGQRCMPRETCDYCLTDAQCGAGKTCTKMGSARFCSQACTPGSTECPRFMDCTDVGSGNFQCVHRAGECQSKTPSLCSPCKGDDTCAQGSMCLSWPSTREQFCGKSCSGDADCGAGYKCYDINKSKGIKQCAPIIKKVGNTSMLSCVSKITPQYEKGDTMVDFAMVGVVDYDGDGQLYDEQPRLVKLSDFKNHSIIFLTVAAGWCSACQQETLDFKNLYKQYGGELVIYQVLYQGFQKSASSYATFDVLKQWNNKLKPIGGTVGVDLTRRIQPYNTGQSTPMSMLIDAKTMKILDKWNGYNHYSLVSKLNSLPQLKKK